MKPTKRKGFNFFRSYFDVYNELSDKDKVAFIDALLNRQFLGIKPTDLKGMAKFAYISQVNSIDSQVKGFEDKTGISLHTTEPPTTPPTQGGIDDPNGTPAVQVQVEGKEKGKVEEKGEKTLAWFQDQFDELFLEQMAMTHKGKDIQQAIKESFAHLGADKLRLSNADTADCKKLLNSWLTNQKYDRRTNEKAPNGAIPRFAGTGYDKPL